ncbi:hypothetical protein JCM10908_003826 [Rhodotorula pacifica]|uniref:uncharacterized protein n=1 Tax=Rhodotorula pacifica TaxID=1495444 RepID=UPI0031711718
MAKPLQPPAAPAPTESPLKQVNQAGAPKRSKLDACWHDLTHNPTLFTATPGASTSPSAAYVPPPKRYFSEFFCLKPSRAAQDKALASLSNQDLLGPYKNNISLLFVHAVRTLKEAKPDDTCRSHAVETLFPLLRNILSREYDNQSYDVMNILAGSLDRSDQVFTDLVSAIDVALQDRKTPTALRHRALQLALLVVSTVGQGSLVAYFLRRDLFSTLVAFIADNETKPFAFEATLLLGLLANYRKCEARNPYGVRIEDFVEEGVMERMIDVVSTVCTRARDAYVAISDDAPPTLVASLTSFVWSLRLSDLFSGGFYLPPPPPPPPAAAVNETENEGATSGSAAVEQGEVVERSGPTAEEKGKGKEKDEPDVVAQADLPPSAAAAATEPLQGSSSTTQPASPPATVSLSAPVSPPLAASSKPSAPSSPLPSASSPSPTPSRTTTTTSPPGAKPVLSRTGSARPVKPEDAPFVDLPPEMVVLLLPFHELLDSNKTFCSLVYSDRSSSEAATSTLPDVLISLVSYMVCHAALSHRARVYSRLAFVVLMILVEEGEGKLTQPRADGEEIRICRQRQPQLPQKDSSRSIPLSALIDTLVLFLRHNLRKRLEVETYTIALRLLQRVFQQLKNEGCKLDRDWVIVWRTLLSLASFIVSHRSELRKLDSSLDPLISQLFVTLAYAAYWSEQLLPDAATQARLYYELLHADETLSALSDLLGISSVAPLSSSTSPSSSGAASPTKTAAPAPVSTYPYLSRRETANHSGFLSLHSTLSSSSPSGLRGHAGSSNGAGGAGANGYANGNGKENARFVATECIANLRSTITFFSGHIAAFKEAKRVKNANSWWPSRRNRSASTTAGDSTAGVQAAGAGEDEDHLEPDEILSIVEANLGSIELIESAAMGDLPRYASEMDLASASGSPGASEAHNARFWKEIVEIACRDTIALLQDEPPVLTSMRTDAAKET